VATDAGLGCWFKTPIGMTIRANYQRVSTVNGEARLLVVIKASLPLHRMTALTFVSQCCVVNVIFLMTTAGATGLRCISKARFRMAIDTLGHRLVSTYERIVSVFRMRKSCGIPNAWTVTSRTLVTQPPSMERIFVTARATLVRRTFVHIPHMAAFTLDTGMLKSQRKSRLGTVKYLEGLLGHALFARLGMATEALVVLVFTAVRLFVLVTT